MIEYQQMIAALTEENNAEVKREVDDTIAAAGFDPEGFVQIIKLIASQPLMGELDGPAAMLLGADFALMLVGRKERGEFSK